MLGNLDENGKMILRSSAVIVAGQSHLLESVKYYLSVVRFQSKMLKCLSEESDIVKKTFKVISSDSQIKEL